MNSLRSNKNVMKSQQNVITLSNERYRIQKKTKKHKNQRRKIVCKYWNSFQSIKSMCATVYKTIISALKLDIKLNMAKANFTFGAHIYSVHIDHKFIEYCKRFVHSHIRSINWAGLNEVYIDFSTIFLLSIFSNFQ